MSDLTIFIIDKDPATCEQATELAQSVGWGTYCFDSVETFLAADGPKRRGCVVADIRTLENGSAQISSEGGSSSPGMLVCDAAEARPIVRAISRGRVRLHGRHIFNGSLINTIRQTMTSKENGHDEDAHLAELRARRESLSADERQVMHLIIAGKPNKLIAKELNIGLRTVESRRHNIFQKMKADSLADLIKMTLAIESS